MDKINGSGSLLPQPKTMMVKAYIPSEDNLSTSNKLLICQNFGFVYDYVNTISMEGFGSINIIFDILNHEFYKLPKALIPRKEHKELFVEFAQFLKYRDVHFDIKVLKEEDYLLVKNNSVRLILPEKTLVFNTTSDSFFPAFFLALESFWSWKCFITGDEKDGMIGYSGTKDLFVKEPNGKH